MRKTIEEKATNELMNFISREENNKKVDDLENKVKDILNNGYQEIERFGAWKIDKLIQLIKESEGLVINDIEVNNLDRFIILSIVTTNHNPLIKPKNSDKWTLLDTIFFERKEK